MEQILYKKGSLKQLKATTMKMEEYRNPQQVYEVSVLCILQFNIDGKGKALVQKGTVEIVEYLAYGSLNRNYLTKTSEYVIMSYSKLEELMLSPDWIHSDYSPDSTMYPIEEIMKKCSPTTKEE